jgi:hypothetical protein
MRQLIYIKSGCHRSPYIKLLADAYRTTPHIPRHPDGSSVVSKRPRSDLPSVRSRAPPQVIAIEPLNHPV